ncbi:MAG: molybdopterin molybdotransferase MoeA [Bacteroidales bacterium]|nr:molybdopterin molybdotransferase MoeA [Bacteroidales bacterium]
MISLQAAYKHCLAAMKPMSAEKIRFDSSLGRVLAQDIRAKRDMPPFNKAAVDGYACIAPVAGQKLSVIGQIAAGSHKHFDIEAGEAVSIMTGAPVPKDADWVVMKEDIEQISEKEIVINRPGRKSNIAIQGEDYKNEEKLLPAGAIIRPQHIGLMAAEGYVEIQVSKLPRVQIVTTGSELVEPDKTPKASQIRNSNAWQLKAQLQAIGIQADYSGIVADDKASLKKVMQSCSNYDLSIFTGGVSMGDFDFVPKLIQDAAYEIIFHKISVKPGKPTLLAKKGNSVILGLPGNPISGFIQFILLGKPMIYAACGTKIPDENLRLPAGERIASKKSDRDSWIPVKFIKNELFPVKYNGSGHLAALSETDGFACVPAEKISIEKGEYLHARSI